MTYVLYVCECGNYVAEPSVAGGPARIAPDVRLGGEVICTAPRHGLLQPPMTRIEVVERPA